MTGTSLIRAIGGLRLTVGLALLAAPKTLTQLDDPATVLLIRTIGVRDLVLGAGTVAAPDEAVTHWGAVGLASDSIDIVVGGLSTPKLGAASGAIATLLPVPFALVGAWALRRARG